jgi:hypothetical protein
MDALSTTSVHEDPPRVVQGEPARRGKARHGLVAAGAYAIGFGFAFVFGVAEKLIASDEAPEEAADGDAPPKPRRSSLRTWLAAKVKKFRLLAQDLKAKRDGIWEYALVTLAYWGFTITDGAIRMLVLFQFYLLGYSAFQIAFLFLFYELFGVATNLVGGWIGANFGLRITLMAGGWIQIASLVMLAFVSASWPVWLVVTWVMVSQALSGIAKDLTKMSSKSAIKSVVPAGSDQTLYRWVSVLTGSKNALKGVGFFVGALLLTVIGFPASLLLMAAALLALQLGLTRYLPDNLGKAKKKSKFATMFSLDRRVNILSAARFFLFAARDVWFVVALPVFMAAIFGWSPLIVAGYLAMWTIGYGIVQSLAPKFIAAKGGGAPSAYSVVFWATVLAGIPAAVSLALASGIAPQLSVAIGLAIFGVFFAINSAVHSFMIVSYSESENAAMTVGFYYMANAGGRLIGTVLSGAAYQFIGIVGCLWVSTFFVGAAAFISTGLMLPEKKREIGASEAPFALLPAPAM